MRWTGSPAARPGPGAAASLRREPRASCTAVKEDAGAWPRRGLLLLAGRAPTAGAAVPCVSAAVAWALAENPGLTRISETLAAVRASRCAMPRPLLPLPRLAGVCGFTPVPGLRLTHGLETLSRGRWFLTAALWSVLWAQAWVSSPGQPSGSPAGTALPVAQGQLSVTFVSLSPVCRGGPLPR